MPRMANDASNSKPPVNVPMMRFGLILALIVVVLDQISKYVVLGPMSFSPPGCLETGRGCGFIELSPIFDLRMVWNQGVSFGLMRADSDLARWGLTGGQFAIAAIFLWWLRTAYGRLTAIALGLVIGGAFGNIIDRIRFGAVADFFDFSGFYFPWVFNVADSAITIGAILLAIDFVFFVEDPPGSGTLWAQFRTWRRARGLAAPATDPDPSPPQNRQDQG
jgi:signal peptidase II